MPASGSEKTEKATPKKRRDERKEGNVFQGKEINIAFSLLIMFVLLKLIGGFMFEFFIHTTRYFISEAGTVKTISPSDARQILVHGLFRAGILALPLLLVSALLAFLLSGIQTRFIFSTKKIRFKINRLNPIEGMKKSFTMRSLVHLLKSVITVLVIGVVIYNNVVDFAKAAPSYYYMPATQALVSIANDFFNIFVKICIVVIVIGILDWFFQWWQYEKNLRMTKQEVKDEYKLTEGDPQVKSAIRSRQQRMAQMRMMQKVPTADVVIVNPEHYAIALKYDDKKNNAPVVVAKGMDYIALKIKETAAEHNVRIEENAPLARALYKAAKLDCEIPAEFYKAVAEILSYVYSLRNARKGKTRPK